MWKRVGIAALVVVLLLVGALGIALYSIFGANKPVEDGATYERTTVIEDVTYISMFLVDAGNGKYVLVDGGVDKKHEKANAALAAKGASPSDLLAVLLTHGHSDHIGAAYGLGDVPLYVHEKDVALTQGEVPAKSPVGGKNDPGLKVDHTFEDGDVLEFGEAKFEVFHTPGHTAGNCAFLVGGVLLLGDTAQVTKDDALAAPPDIFTADPAEAIESIRALARRLEDRPEKPNTIVGAHSGSTKNVSALFEFKAD